ncbi:hypothetical protein F5Y15DRAFT_224914 [Xylariaceae sp. FL0016]|nr:hypothetical protein F5Y15DRAFT_224914 [Xylariaceae sp. FL0016]
MHANKNFALLSFVAAASAQSSSPAAAITTDPAMLMSGSMVVGSSSMTAMPSSSMMDPANVTAAPTYSYYNTTITTTLVVDVVTTSCAEATTLTFNGCEYPATAGEVVVVTDCPCMVTTAMPTLTSELCPPGVAATGAANPAPAPAGGVPPVSEEAPVPGEGESSESAMETAPMPSGVAAGTMGVMPTGTAMPSGVQVAGAAARGVEGAVALAAVGMGVLVL